MTFRENLKDIWSGWWGDVTWPKWTMTMTLAMAFREHPQRAILTICDLRLDTWDTDYISDNWEQQYEQLHCDLWIQCDGDSIRNSCDVLFFNESKGLQWCGGKDEDDPEDRSLIEKAADCFRARLNQQSVGLGEEKTNQQGAPTTRSDSVREIKISYRNFFWMVVTFFFKLRHSLSYEKK